MAWKQIPSIAMKFAVNISLFSNWFIRIIFVFILKACRGETNAFTPGDDGATNKAALDNKCTEDYVGIAGNTFQSQPIITIMYYNIKFHW